MSANAKMGLKVKLAPSLVSEASMGHSLHSTSDGTLESVIDVGPGISIGPGRFGKKNKRRALNKRRAWKIWKKE